VDPCTQSSTFTPRLFTFPLGPVAWSVCESQCRDTGRDRGRSQRLGPSQGFDITSFA
jgi:hypothetical protein